MPIKTVGLPGKFRVGRVTRNTHFFFALQYKAYNSANLDWFVQFLFCRKIEYVNLGLLISLFYFDTCNTLLQFIERNSDSVSKCMLLILIDLLPPLFEITRISFKKKATYRKISPSSTISFK